MSFPTMEKQQMRTLRWVLVAAVAVLVSCGGGSSSTTSEVSPTSTVARTEVVYKVGDTGPGGGIIVYVDEAGFNNSSEDDHSIGEVCMTGTCHYLEMAPADVEGIFSWSDAITAAEKYSTTTANDWVLPSSGALNKMCKYAFKDTVNVSCNENGLFLNSIGDFSTEYYWSSSEVFGASASIRSFYDGSPNLADKFESAIAYRVRPVRAFSGSASSSNSDAPIVSCAQGGICVVGDTGPGGGIIVYVDEAGFNNSSGDDTSIGAMCLIGTCHYLEMAPTDLEGQYSWDEAIVAAEADTTSTAYDWVLPSIEALNLMCKYAFGDIVNAICNNSGSGGLSGSLDSFLWSFYWSSSGFNHDYAWMQNFYIGRPSNDLKYMTVGVRSVRAF